MENIASLKKTGIAHPYLPGVELRPFFTKILAWTTFVHFSNPGAKNPSLDELLGIYTLFLSNFWGFTHFFVEFCRDRRLRAFYKIFKILASSLFSLPCLSQILSNTPDIAVLSPSLMVSYMGYIVHSVSE